MTHFYRHLSFIIFSNLTHDYLPTMESHCSQNESAVALARGAWCACALQWKHLPYCPAVVFCGIVSHSHSLVFLFTK